MNRDALIQELLQLRATLQMNIDASKGDHNALTEMMDNLANPKLTTTDNSEEIATQIQQLVVDYETEHPTISHVLRQIGDTLAKIGI